MITQTQQDLITARKRQGVTKQRKKPPKWLFPHGLEREYTRDLYRLTAHLRKLINEILVPEIPSMIKENAANTPEPVTVRGDDFLDRLEGLVIVIRRLIQPTVEQTITESVEIGRQVAAFNGVQFHKTVNSVFGIDIFANEPWLQDQLSLFASQNAQLITSIADQELDDVAQIVERRLQEGSRFEVVQKDLIKRFGVTRRRAKLIARDQVTKLNASLTKLRQQELGVEEYIWQTSGDERVRPTHKANDGKRFKWSEPSPITGHPGTDIQCRCVAIPVLEGILE